MTEPIEIENDANEIFDNDCAEFQALMSERIGAGEDLQSYDHMLTCERCRALVYDLEQIAIAARELMGMDQDPAGDLWERLKGRLGEDPKREDDSDDLTLPALN